jgi:hypothetical protein
LHRRCAKPRPVGRVLGRFLCGLGKFVVFDAARSRSYAKWIVLNDVSGRFVV